MTNITGFDPASLDYTKGGGLVPVVAQHHLDGAVLMVAYADREAMDRTIESGELHFRSRTRGLWKKGETSGNVLKVVQLFADCDNDTVLARVMPRGPTCHTGSRTCFGEGGGDMLAELDSVLQQRAVELADGADTKSYTRRLLSDKNLRLKKLGEEMAELIVAIYEQDKSRAAEEAADVFYHVMVALRGAGVDFEEVRSVLAVRAKK